jgi:hypothetical protein
MVLVISLMILSLLLGAGVGAIVSTQTDLKTTGNLKTGMQAFYLAEAGIEWGKQQVKSSVVSPPNAGESTQALSPGTFTVSFLSPVQLSNLAGTVTIRSTGAVGRSAYTVEARVTKLYDLSDAPIGLRGKKAGAKFIGDSFQVDGRDYDPLTGELVRGAGAQFGISVPDGTLREQVLAELTDEQKKQVVGKGETTPSVEQSDVLSSDAIAQLANELCSAPDAVVENIPPSGTLSVSGTTTWGTRTDPQLRCINGLVGAGDKIEIGGTFAGVGVLVVRNADLVAIGSLRWEGLILVTGNNVGFRVEGGGDKDLFGSLLVNETSAESGEGTEEIQLQGVIRVRYSSSALQRGARLFPRSALEVVYRDFPAVVSQNYWRAENY